MKVNPQKLTAFIKKSFDNLVTKSRDFLRRFDPEATHDEIDLNTYDAGTDSGTSFTSSDRDTQPREPIFLIVDAPLSPGGNVTPVGTFTFTRIN